MTSGDWPAHASKSQLTKAGDLLRKGGTAEEEAAALEAIDTWRATFAPAANATAMWIRGVVDREGIQALQIRSRYKRLPSLLTKIHRMPRTRVPQIEDVAGCRVVVPNLEHLRHLQAALRESPARNVGFPREVDDDYTDLPQKGGYRAVHLHTLRTVRTHGPWKVEIQLRTERQHQWAELVEEFDRIFGQDLKHGNAPGEVMDYYLAASDALHAAETTGVTPAHRERMNDAYDGMARWMEGGGGDEQ